ncbi:hypothetical protein H6P81_000604 [Aristolochia fimbriata]|uniref:La protein 1 n=1 Tax=Aristolochia fimbriata TaxID=158543 RepID=A0AAV7F5W6_ARIFI|nr:hypothetical protein H6P81_000604 [Aristolochia fimbriata]
MATTSLDEEASKNVLRQVEFYFSDSNLPRDRFLTNTINESEDGLVSLALICSFTRMRNHLGLGSIKPDDVPEETVAAVAETLRKSSSLKVSEDGKKVGRSTELLKPEEVIEQIDSRTVAAGPLPYDVKLEDVQSYFSKYGKVNSVRLPRHAADKRCFCGTALIEFSSEEDAKNILNQDVAYAGAELELKTKKIFDAERQEMIANQKSHTSHDSHTADSYPKGLIVAFKLKSLSKEEAAKDESRDGHETDGTTKMEAEESVSKNAPDMDEKPSNGTDKENEGEDHEPLTEEGEEKVTEDATQEHGGEAVEGSNAEDNDAEEAPSSMESKDSNDIVLREDLKHVFQRFGTVKFVDYSMGKDSGYIRFDQPEAGQKARAAAALAEEGGLVVKNFVAILEPVTGEAEKEYWTLLRSNQDRNRESRSNRGRGGRNNNRGGKRFDGKHPRSSGGLLSVSSFAIRREEERGAGAPAILLSIQLHCFPSVRVIEKGKDVGRKSSYSRHGHACENADSSHDLRFPSPRSLRCLRLQKHCPPHKEGIRPDLRIRMAMCCWLKLRLLFHSFSGNFYLLLSGDPQFPYLQRGLLSTPQHAYLIFSTTL